MRNIIIALLTIIIAISCNAQEAVRKNFVQNFKNPPMEVRPQAWWWWLQTPTSKEAITLDLEEMKAKGLSGCMVLDGGVGPFGPYKWKKKTIIDSTEIRYELTDEYKGGSLTQPEETMECGRSHGAIWCVLHRKKRVG